MYAYLFVSWMEGIVYILGKLHGFFFFSQSHTEFTGHMIIHVIRECQEASLRILDCYYNFPKRSQGQNYSFLLWHSCLQLVTTK